MGNHSYSSDLSGLRDELLSGLRSLRQEVEKESQKVGEAVGEGVGNGIEESTEAVRRSEKELREELSRLQKNLEKTLVGMPDIIRKAFSGGIKQLDVLPRTIRTIKKRYREIHEIYRELEEYGVSTDSAEWIAKFDDQFEHLKGVMGELPGVAGKATDAVETHSDAIERQAQVTESAARSQQKLNKAMREQPKSGGNKMSADNSTAALMKGTNINRLLKKLNVSKEDAEKVLTKFGQLAHMIAEQTRFGVVENSVDLDLMDSIDQTMKEIADMIMSVGSVKRDNEKERLQDFYDYMRGTLIGYTDSDIAEFGDGWADIKKRFGSGKYKVLDKNAPKVDTIWQDIVDGFGELLDDETEGRPQQQLQQVLNLLQKARDERKSQKTTYDRLPDSYFEDIIVDINNDTAIIEQNADKMVRKTMEAAAQERELARAAGDARKAIEGQASAASKVNSELSDGYEDDGDEEQKTKKLSVLKHEVDSALDRLRRASNNKTAFIDLTEVKSNSDLERQVGEMAQRVVGADLKVDSVIVQDDIARITLYNEELGITASQMWQLKESTDGAKKAQLELISETEKHSPRAAQKYSDAQQRQIENDNKWLIAQMSRLNTLERQYRHSGKKIDGSSVIGDLDGTSMEKDIDGTIDNLAAHIKNRISESMDGVLTDKTKNAILNDLRILDNEIKIQQYEQYASTTMSPTEVGEARKQFEYMLNSLEAKAKKNNVFDQMSESFTQLRNRLTDDSLVDYVKDGTDVGKFVDSLRTIKTELNAAIAAEGVAKKEEQNYQNLLNLQERLYNAKKKLAELDAKGDAVTSDGMKAARVTAELQQQYDAAVRLLHNDEQRNAAKERQAQLEKELNAFISEQQAKQKKADDKSASEEQAKGVKQYYQEILDIINRINSLDSDILGLQKKNKSGVFTDVINSMQAEKQKLIAEITSIGQIMSGQFGAGELNEKYSIDGSRFFTDQDAQNINSFLNSVQVQSVLTEQEINKLADAFTKSKTLGADAANTLAQSFMKVADSAKTLSANSFIDKNSDIYQGTVDAFKQYTDKVASLGGAQNASDWSAEDYAEVEALAKSYLELAGAFEVAAAKQQSYFKGKTEYKSGDGMTSIISEGQAKELNEQQSAYDALKKKADEFAQASGASGAIVTKFVEDANGISRLDFSVLDKGTMTMKKFSMEMGSLNQNKTFLSGMDVSSFTNSINAAQKQMESISSLMQTLRGYNISLDASSVSRLVEVYRQLEQQMAKGSSADESKVSSLTKEAKVCQAEVEKLLKQMLQMESAIRNDQATGLGKIDPNGDVYGQLAAKAKEFAASNGNVTLELGKFDKVTNTLNASLIHTNGTVEQFKVSMYGLGGECAAQQAGVTKLTTSWDRFKVSIGQAGKHLMTALVGYNAFFKVISEVRKGIGYVKEIDLALTELKKVTDETEESYKKFLNTAASTAGEIGSTVSDFTEASANFARLGYTMEESAEMAKTAIVYKNVADGLDTVDEATDSIISTMKAFGIESNDTMGIIDRFNEIGNNFAITSAGIGEALQRSASALYAGGNTIDESIALVTAANSVIQNPEQVGELLADYKVA